MTDLNKIYTISGKPGLHKNVAVSKTGLIVESLIDGKRFNVFAHEKMSALGEISIFKVGGDILLIEVLKKIKEKYESKPVANADFSGPQLRIFMEEILPDYDPERVYTSDIKKILSWYNLLAEKDMLEFKEDEPEEEHASEQNTEPNTDESAE